MKLTFSVSQLMQAMEENKKSLGGGASSQACATSRNESETDIKLIENR